jgi:hypothetical protein
MKTFGVDREENKKSTREERSGSSTHSLSHNTI